MWFITWLFISGTTVAAEDVRDFKDDKEHLLLVSFISSWASGPLLFIAAGDVRVLSWFSSSSLLTGIILIPMQFPFSDEELFLQL